ncbi:MAG: hypothetical protein IPN92_11330 [Chromatiaceae bacterium]|nr:hypothetical protein [Chromatiaceae bacterium]
MRAAARQYQGEAPRHLQTAQVVPQRGQPLSAHHLALPAPVGPHQQARTLGIACQGEEFEQVGLAVADAHQGGLGHLGAIACRVR